uniref:GOLD domain-containing protein n=1 Tax=Trichuris muris TaxID=70415 RepID=A0A5S6R5K6_TRIMR
MKKHLSLLGLLPIYNRDGEFALAARMIIAIAFVPEDHVDRMFEQMNYIGTQNRFGSRRIPPFPPKVWSAYRRTLHSRDRTNNFAEAAHRRLKSELGVDHPTIWRFIDGLRTVQAGRDQHFECFVRGDEPPRKRQRYLLAGERIRLTVGRFHADSDLLYLRVYTVDSLDFPIKPLQLRSFAVCSESLMTCCLLVWLLMPARPVCLKEEIHKNVVVTGEYKLSEAPGMRSSVVVTDSKNHILFQRENFLETDGKFAFTTDEMDVFEVCVSTHAQHGIRGASREVSLDIRHGVDAKDYEQIAKAEHLMPLEMELKRMEDLSESLVQDFAYMRQREEDMRSTNETTYSRVLYLSILSVVCLLCLATWQVLYLRRFFKAKKLID